MTIIKIENEQQWHGLRRKCIGASEVAALVGTHPYLTPNKLYHMKRGGFEEQGASSIATFGNLMEPIIAQLAADKSGWQLEDRHEHEIADHCPAAGCTIDRYVVESERGQGILEIKNVIAFSPGWTETRAPDHIEWQMQHQLFVTGKPWGAICSLHGGNPDDLRIMFREPNKKAFKAIRERCTKFMEDVAHGVEPDITDPKDYDHIRDMFLDAETMQPEKEFEAREMDKEFDDLVHKYTEAGEQRKLAADIEKQTKAEILRALMVPTDGGFQKELLAMGAAYFVKVSIATNGAIRLIVKDPPENMNMGE